MALTAHELALEITPHAVCATPSKSRLQSLELAASWLPLLVEMYAGSALPYLGLLATKADQAPQAATEAGDCGSSVVGRQQHESLAAEHGLYRCVSKGVLYAIQLLAVRLL